jgi:hypothetical protein
VIGKWVDQLALISTSELWLAFFIAFRNNTSLSLIGRTCAVEVKKVLDSRFLILVTRCEKRSKKIYEFSDLNRYLPALLIEVLTACRGGKLVAGR